MKYNLKTIFLILFVFVNLGFVNADEFDYARNLIQSKIPCNQLNDSQLEQLGDYYMEQMHPGELHTLMENRLGGEGSENVRLVHISMGKSFYCGDSGAMSSGMMNFMMGRSDNYTYGGMMYGGGNGRMMGGYRYTPVPLYSNEYSSWNITSILIDLILFLIIVGLILGIVKLSQRKK